MAIQDKVESLKFDGVSGIIASQLFTRDQQTSKFAVVFPGAGYSYREPLLRFGIQVLLMKGYQVLGLDKIYGDDPNWRNLKSEQEARKIVEDGTVKIISQIDSRFSKTPDLLFGRSLGTFAMACLLEHIDRPEKHSA